MLLSKWESNVFKWNEDESRERRNSFIDPLLNGGEEKSRRMKESRQLKNGKNRGELRLPKTVPPTKRNAWLHYESHAPNADQPDTHSPTTRSISHRSYCNAVFARHKQHHVPFTIHTFPVHFLPFQINLWNASPFFTFLYNCHWWHLLKYEMTWRNSSMHIIYYYLIKYFFSIYLIYHFILF